MIPGSADAPSPLPPDEVWRLEELALNAWPALQTALVEGWLLRFAEGFTKRANSACALPGARPLQAVLPEIEARYAARGIGCCIRLTPQAPTGTAALLADRGWRIFDETLIQVAPLLPASGSSAPPGLVLAREASSAWIEGYAAASRRPDLRPDTLARMLAAIGTPVAFATLSDGTRPVAYGMAARERGWVGLFDIATDPVHRGRGHAGRLVSGLMGWAADTGDRHAYLQVTAANAPARALYRRLGFHDAYRYAYAVPGEPTAR